MVNLVSVYIDTGKKRVNATIRGYQNMMIDGYDHVKEVPNDFYATPLNFCLATLDMFSPAYQPQRIFDPGAGTGRWGMALKQRWANAHLTGVEIDETLPHPQTTYNRWLQGDFRNMDKRVIAETSSLDEIRVFDLVIGNPPYGVTNGKRDRRLAEKFVDKSRQLVLPNGFIVFLLSTVFLESEIRGEGLFKHFPPTYVYVSSERIPFRPETKGKKTNTVSYSLFVWDMSKKFSEPRIRWFKWRTGKMITNRHCGYVDEERFN